MRKLTFFAGFLLLLQNSNAAFRATTTTAPLTTTTTALSTTSSGQDLNTEIKNQLSKKYQTYTGSLINAQTACNSASGSVDSTINELGALLGAGIGQIAGGVIGAGAGGANVYLTGKTIQDTNDIADLKAKAEANKVARKKIYDEKLQLSVNQANIDSLKKNSDDAAKDYEIKQGELDKVQKEIDAVNAANSTNSAAVAKDQEAKKLRDQANDKRTNDPESKRLEAEYSKALSVKSSGAATAKLKANYDAAVKKRDDQKAGDDASILALQQAADAADAGAKAQESVISAAQAKLDAAKAKIPSSVPPVCLEQGIDGNSEAKYKAMLEQFKAKVFEKYKSAKANYDSIKGQLDSIPPDATAPNQFATKPFKTTGPAEFPRVEGAGSDGVDNSAKRADLSKKLKEAQNAMQILKLDAADISSFSTICGTSDPTFAYTSNKDGTITIIMPQCNGGMMAKAKAFNANGCTDKLAKAKKEIDDNKLAVSSAQKNFDQETAKLGQLKSTAADKSKQASDKRASSQKVYQDNNAAADRAMKAWNDETMKSVGTDASIQAAKGAWDKAVKAAVDAANELDAKAKAAEDEAVRLRANADATKSSGDSDVITRFEKAKQETALAKQKADQTKADYDKANVVGVPKVDMDQATQDLNTKSPEEIKLDEAQKEIDKRRGVSTALDITGVVSGVGTGIAGGIGLSKSKSISETIDETSAELKTCNDALVASKTNGADLQSFVDDNYDIVKDSKENKQLESMQMAITNMSDACDGVFDSKDFESIKSELKSAGISSGVALVGAVGTGVSSTGAMIAKEDENKKTWRIASTVSSGVSGVSGVVSTVLASKVKKILVVAKKKESDCLDALNAIKL